MKKKIAFICLALWGLQSNAQTVTPPIDSVTKKITFTEVIKVDGVSKDELYKRAKNLGIAGDNIKTDDAANGTYTYKGSMVVSYPAPQPGLAHTGNVAYEVTLICKDGRYKYIITGFTHTSPKANGGKLEGKEPECGKYTLTLAGWAAIKKSTWAQTDKLIANIKLKMQNPAANTGGGPSDW